MIFELGFLVNKSHKEGNVTVVTDLTLLEVSAVQSMLTLKDHVAGNVEFQYYRAGNLMYKTSTGLEFPVPINDTNDATFPRTEKGIFFMRWIRKHLQTTIQLTDPIETSKFLTKSGFNKVKFTP